MKNPLNDNWARSCMNMLRYSSSKYTLIYFCLIRLTTPVG